MKTFSILLFALLFNCNAVKENQEKKSIPLEGTTWVWQYTEKNIQKTYPKKKDAFSISFNKGNINISTDCNTMGGTYTQNEEVFELGMLMATKMYCPDSQEGLFAGMLSQSKKITWNDKELQLLSKESGTMYFTKK
jgi:heat shock protein HslJ